MKKKSKMGTKASNISETGNYENKNVVKGTTKETLDNLNFPEAINFSRKLKTDTKNSYHHVGIYCYHFETLKDFVNFKQSGNELKNKLEQLRALDNNIKSNVALTNSPPIGVDSMEDYVAIKKLMEYKST